MKTSAFLLMGTALPLQIASAAITLTDTFTYSGRKMMWTASIDAARDTSVPQPAYLLFPGTVEGTPEGFLQLTSPTAMDFNRTQAGYTITLSPPDNCAAPDQTYRCWSNGKDDSIVLAAIRTSFNRRIKIDTNRIVLHGRSAGTCFLDPLLQNHRFGWKGGSFLECGCHSDVFTATPTEEAMKNFRIYIATTSGDFLRRGSLAALDYFKYWAGYDVRWNINSKGDHCASPSPVYDSASRWLTGANLPAPPAEPHWQRLLPLTGIKSVAVSPKGVYWVARSASNQTQVWKSTDDGLSWTQPLQRPDSLDPATGKLKTGLGGMALVGETVVVSHRDSLLLIEPNGTIRSRPGSNGPLNADSTGRLWRGIQNPWYSVDTGRTWKAMPTGVEVANQLSRTGVSDKSASLLFQRKLSGSSYPNFAIAWNGTSKDTSSYPLPDSTLAWTRKADTFLVARWNGTSQTLVRKVVGKPDTSTWQPVDWPTDALQRSPSTSKSPAVQPDWNPTTGTWILMGAPSYESTVLGKWTRMAGIWLTDANEPGAFSPFGKGVILRSGKDGNGLLVWTNTDLESLRKTAHRGRDLSSRLAFRKGAHLELAGSERTVFAIRWIDALGRTVGSTMARGGQEVPLQSPRGGNLPTWMEIRSQGRAEIFSTPL